MGTERAELTITARLSRHNSENDDIDNELWEDLVKQIVAIIEQSKFERISPMAN